jgi:hypothetical protein
MKPGDRIRLLAMPDDPNPIPVSPTAIVQRIVPVHRSIEEAWDQVYVKWDSGRTLMLCIPPDVVEVVT